MSTPSDQSLDPKNSPLMAALQELMTMHGSHRLNVIVAHGLLELLINTFVEAKCKHGKDITSHSRDYTHSAKLVILHELGLLTDSEFARFDWLRKLRNRAAHETRFAIESRDLHYFPEFSDPAQFELMCITLVVGFWNRHVELFGPRIMPELYTKSQNRP
jgi:hypothetical protein